MVGKTLQIKALGFFKENCAFEIKKFSRRQLMM
mgnify:CR=1 FL=1